MQHRFKRRVMDTFSSTEVSDLLVAWGNGDESALEKLIPVVYEELHSLATRYMRRESLGHTLQTSALVNEAYLKLVDQKNVRPHADAITIITHHNWVWENLGLPRSKISVLPAEKSFANCEILQ